MKYRPWKRSIIFPIATLFLLGTAWGIVSPFAFAEETSYQNVELTQQDPNANEMQYFQKIANKWIDRHNTQADSPATLKAKIIKQANAYTLDVGDTLEVNIPDLFIPTAEDTGALNSKNAQVVPVLPNGTISVAPFGTFNVAGLSIDELQSMLTEMAQYYLVKPRVAVSIIQPRPFTIYVQGQVKHPGSYQVQNLYNHSKYEIDTNPNFIEKLSSDDVLASRRYYKPKLSLLIAQAGGILPHADLRHIEIHNQAKDTHKVVNLLEVFAGDTTQDVYLTDNDVVFIPEGDEELGLLPELANSTIGPQAFPIHVFGYVSKRGGQQNDIYLPADSMDLLSALSSANIDPTADATEIVVLRQNGPDSFEKIEVNAYETPFQLKPHDSIVVADRKFSSKLRDILLGVSRIAIGYGQISRN